MQKAAILLAGLALVLTARPAPAQTALTIAATGEVSASPDEADASFTAQASAPDAATAQASVNKAIAQALALARGVPGVAATTSGYATSQTISNDQPPQITYTASQSLSLSIPAAGGSPPARFAALLGSLQQDGLLLNGLDGGLSSSAEAKAEQNAIAAGIVQVQQQAAAIAAQLHESVGAVKTLTVNVTPWQRPFEGRLFTAMAANAAFAPSSAPQAISVSASITAEIDLKPAP